MSNLSIIPRRYPNYLSENARKIELVGKSHVLGNPVDRLLRGIEIVAGTLHPQVLDKRHGGVAGHLLEQLDNPAWTVMRTSGKRLEGDFLGQMALCIGDQILNNSHPGDVQRISGQVLLLIGEGENQGSSAACSKHVPVCVSPRKRGENLGKQAQNNRL